MKNEAEIIQRIQDVIAAEYERQVRDLEDRAPTKCQHNYRHPLDSRKVVGGEPNDQYNRISRDGKLPVLQTVGLCMVGSDHPADWSATICEDTVDAQRCPLYRPTRTRSDLLSELELNLSNSDWLGHNLPEVFALLWVLGKPSASVPFWLRWLLRLFRVRPKPLLSPFDPKALLPPDSSV